MCFLASVRAEESGTKMQCRSYVRATLSALARSPSYLGKCIGRLGITNVCLSYSRVWSTGHFYDFKKFKLGILEFAEFLLSLVFLWLVPSPWGTTLAWRKKFSYLRFYLQMFNSSKQRESCGQLSYFIKRSPKYFFKVQESSNIKKINIKIKLLYIRQ